MIKKIRKLINTKSLTYIFVFLVAVSTVWLYFSLKKATIADIIHFIDFNDEKQDVVKIIHFSWKRKDNIPKDFEEIMKSWTEYCYKNWTIMFWTDEDNFNFIKSHYSWFLKKYNDLPGNIYRADVSRYFYLFHYGGIYTDLDNQCLRPFDHLLRNHSIVFGAMSGQWQGTKLKEGYVQNSFMYSKPKQIFWLELILEILNFRGNDYPEGYTGPIILSKKIDSFRKTKIHKIKIYHPIYFNPFSWLDNSGFDKNCPDRDNIEKEKLISCRESMIAKGTFVVQYHAHTWG